MDVPRLASFLLLGLLALQAAGAYSDRVRTRRAALQPFLPGQELRGTYVAADGTRLRTDTTCWHAYFMSTDCEHCRRLARAAALGPARRDDQVVWLFPQTADHVSGFMEDAGLGTGRAYSLTNGASLRDVGVFATPTLATFRGTRLMHLTMATHPLTEALSDSLCAGAVP
jgi:hypothetical protein